MEFKPRIIETESFAPLEKGICIECKRKMLKKGNNYKCMKCGIEVSYKK